MFSPKYGICENSHKVIQILFMIRPILYIAWVRPKHWPNSIRPNFVNFCGSNLATCKVTRPDFRSRCSWRISVVKRSNLPWTNGTGIGHMSPIRPMLRVWAEDKLILVSPSRPEGLASKVCHLRRHMGWVSVHAQP